MGCRAPCLRIEPAARSPRHSRSPSAERPRALTPVSCVAFLTRRNLCCLTPRHPPGGPRGPRGGLSCAGPRPLRGRRGRLTARLVLLSRGRWASRGSLGSGMLRKREGTCLALAPTPRETKTPRTTARRRWPPGSRLISGSGGACGVGVVRGCYLVDPASSHMLVSKIKPCMCKYELIQTVKLRMAH